MKKNAFEKIRQIIIEHKNLIAQIEETCPELLIEIAETITNSLKYGGTVYVCGNGGSAADAQHIASELVGRFELNRKALPAVAITTDTSLLTSVSNDYDFKNIFVRQVDALVKRGDILWCISTSGRSANVLSAAKLARAKGAVVIAFTGKMKSPLQKVSDLCFCSGGENTARTQEIHQLAYHIVCGLIEDNLFK